MKREMAFVLSKSRQRREYEEQREQRSTQHDVSFRRGSRLFKRSVTGNGQRTVQVEAVMSETAAARSGCASHGSKRTFAVCRLRQRPVKSRSRQKPRAKKRHQQRWYPLAGTGRNRLKYQLVSIFHRKLAASIGCEDHNDGEHGPDAKFGRPIARGKWAGNSSCHDRRNAGVGLLRESGEGSLHAGGLRGPGQLLHKGESLAGRVESSHGFGGESRRYG